MFGTKCPSITSTWIHFAPACFTFSTSRPRFAKSAESIDGEIIIIEDSKPSFTKLQERLNKEGIEYKTVSFPNYDSPSSSLVKI